MNPAELYHFIFETYTGLAILVGLGLVISVIACVIWEYRTRKVYQNHEKGPDDWSLFDDGEGDEDED